MENISQHFTLQAQVLPYQQATKAALTNQALEEKNCLHFSCNGYFNFNQPMQSALILAGCFLEPPTSEPDPLRHLPLRNGSVINLSR